MTSPLTTFIIEMLRAPRDRLTKADPARLAAKYGIRVDHAAGFLRLHLGGE